MFISREASPSKMRSRAKAFQNLAQSQYPRILCMIGALALFGIYQIFFLESRLRLLAAHKSRIKEEAITPLFYDALKQTSRLSIDTSAPKERKLVLVATLGNPQNTNLVRYNIDTHFADWECIMFSYVSEEKLPDPPSHCGVVRLLGASWSEFFGRIPMAAIRSRYDYVAVLLDDVYLPRYGENPVNVTKLLTTMKRHDLASISPAIDGSFWEATRPTGPLSPNTSESNHLQQEQKAPTCMLEVPAIETFVQIFDFEAFLCWQSLNANYKENPQASCIDLCFLKKCADRHRGNSSDFKLSVDKRMVAYHVGKVPVPGSALVPKSGDAYGLRDVLPLNNDDPRFKVTMTDSLRLQRDVGGPFAKLQWEKYCNLYYCYFDHVLNFESSSAPQLECTAH